MQIRDEFRVQLPLERAWTTLLDVERVAQCMPGAQLEEVHDDAYSGTVKVKVGPITTQYRGVARIVETDEAARRIGIQASGRDTQRQGNASARITLLLAPDADATSVALEIDLEITGRVAQFGRGVLADVSAKLLAQFVESLHSVLLAPEDVSEDDSPPPATSPSPEPREPAPVDLGRLVVPAVARRVVPAVAAAIVVAAVVVWLARR